MHPSTPGALWQPFAPLNRGPDGRIYRKVRLPIPGGGGEWVWARVLSEDARAGELANEPHHASGTAGDVIRFTLDDMGRGIVADDGAA